MVAAFKKKHTLEQTGFALQGDGFVYEGRFFPFSEVIETRIMRSVLEHKVILVGSDYHHSISIMIGVKSGELMQVTEQPTWLSDSKLSSVEHVENLFGVISEKSWSNRVAKYTNQLEASGFYESNGWRFYPKKRGIQDAKSGKSFHLDSVDLLKSYGYIEVKAKSEGLGSKLLKNLVGGRVGIGTLIDTDVFFALLKHFFNISWQR